MTDTNQISAAEALAILEDSWAYYTPEAAPAADEDAAEAPAEYLPYAA